MSPLSVKRYLAPSDFSAAETWRLLEWCLRLGADEFTIDCLETDGLVGDKVWHTFEKLVRSSFRGEDTRERMSGRTADDLTRLTPLWHLNETTIDALQRAMPEGLFSYAPAEHGSFEDPVLYRDGQLLLGVLSHEAFAVLRVSEAESAQLSAAGFRSHDSLPRAV